MSETPMPEALQRAVTDLSQDFRTTASESWVDIGEAGRTAYRRYLDRAWTARGLRKRSQLAAMQLCYPTVGYTNWGAGG
jgi:hypothetical protein